MGLKRKPPQGNVRRVRSNGKTTTGALVNKAGRTNQTESFGEIQCLRLVLDRDHMVRDHLSQPETLQFIDDKGKTHHYTPDVMVWRTDDTIELHEVTISARRSREDQQRREQAATLICATRGWRYVIHTEKTLPQPTERANLLLLALFRPPAVAHPAVLGTYRQALPPGIHVTFTNLIERLVAMTQVTETDVSRTLCHLLWHGRVQADLQRLLFIDGQPVTGLEIWRDGDIV